MVFILKVSANFSQYQLFFLTFIEDYELIYGRLLIAPSAPRVGVLNLSIRLVWYNSIKDKLLNCEKYTWMLIYVNKIVLLSCNVPRQESAKAILN